MIAAEFWGVKARKSHCRRDFAEAATPTAEEAGFPLIHSFVRKQTVRIRLHMLNSARINRSRGKTVKKYV